MNNGRLVFTQIMDLVYREQLDRCLRRYPMPRSSRSFSGRDQFLTMAFAQITFRESLRDIEACLRGSPHLHAMGIRGEVTRTNLAYANEHRDWRVFADLAQTLIRMARRRYAADRSDLDLDEIVYAIDSTTIDLCLNLFPWARYRQDDGAIKLHTQIDLRGNIPTCILISDGKRSDVSMLDEIEPERGSIYLVDRGYLDYARLYRLHEAHAFFVTRAKKGLSCYVSHSTPVDRTTGLTSDQLIRLRAKASRASYPERLRRIRFVDPASGDVLVFLTNHLKLPALTIAGLYKSRWQIELFFKWLKQNLRIKSFYGHTENAVKTQIWIAICVYLMVACLKKDHGLPENLSRILQVLSVNVFQKEAVDQLLTELETSERPIGNSKQLAFNYL